MSVVSKELAEWLVRLRREVEQTNPGFVGLNPEQWPVPFFGDIRTARALTVGVNPAPNEFNAPRWDSVRTDSDWIHRLLNYFHIPIVPPHSWFLPWEASLRLIGCSYEDRTAAHLDLSPRSTMVMRNIPEEFRGLFCDMINGDAHWVFEALEFAPAARVVLTAGTLIKPNPNEWLSIGDAVALLAPPNRVSVVPALGAPRLIAHNGRFCLPLFSFPRGPAAPDRFSLIEAVNNARDSIVPCLR